MYMRRYIVYRQLLIYKIDINEVESYPRHNIIEMSNPVDIHYSDL